MPNELEGNGIEVKKVVSEDRTQVDYTRGNFGIRVWKDKCQAIAREDDRSPWYLRDPAYKIPVADSFQNLPEGNKMEPVSALALEAGVMEQHHNGRELRKLLRGQLSFGEAVEAG